MYPGTLRSPAGGGTTGAGSSGGGGSALPVSNFMAAPAYTHYMGYSPVASLDLHRPPLAAWGSPYSPLQEDCSASYLGPSGAMSTVPMNDVTSNPAAFSSQEYSNLGPADDGSTGGSLPVAAGGSLFPTDAGTSVACSPSRSHYSPYAWTRKAIQVTGE